MEVCLRNRDDKFKLHVEVCEYIGWLTQVCRVDVLGNISHTHLNSAKRVVASLSALPIINISISRQESITLNSIYPKQNTRTIRLFPLLGP